MQELDAREARVRANTNPRYRKFAKLCLAQIARERAELDKTATIADTLSAWRQL